MNLVQRINARLVGVRLYLLAVLCPMPDVLDAVVGFDWSSVLPPSYVGYGAWIGSALALARLALTPILKSTHPAPVRAMSRMERRADGLSHHTRRHLVKLLGSGIVAPVLAYLNKRFDNGVLTNGQNVTGDVSVLEAQLAAYVEERKIVAQERADQHPSP